MLHRDRYSSTPCPLDANSAPQWNPMAMVQHEGLDVGFSVRISCACVCKSEQRLDHSRQSWCLLVW